MKRRLKDAFKRLLFRLYRLGSRLGVHVMPAHYYVGAVDIAELERTRDQWQRKSDLPGLNIDLDKQLSALRNVCLPFRDEYASNTAYHEAVAASSGPGYGYVEAQTLHAVIRHCRPARIIEVGSGVSTHCMRTALELNRRDGAAETTMTCVEPYPSKRLLQTPGITLLQQPVQAVAVEVFRVLQAKDFLFIDSSHTVKPASDVNYLLLEVLLVLKPGVILHIHDIYLPYDYQRNVLKTFMHWSETSLLRAYLAHYNRVAILFCLSHLHYEHRAQVQEVFPDYDPAPDDNGLNLPTVRPFEQPRGHFPSSIYLETR